MYRGETVFMAIMTRTSFAKPLSTPLSRWCSARPYVDPTPLQSFSRNVIERKLMMAETTFRCENERWNWDPVLESPPGWAFASQPAIPAPDFSWGTLRVLCDVMIKILTWLLSSLYRFWRRLHMCYWFDTHGDYMRDCHKPLFYRWGYGELWEVEGFVVNHDQAAPPWWHQDWDPGRPGSPCHTFRALLDHQQSWLLTSHVTSQTTKALLSEKKGTRPLTFPPSSHGIILSQELCFLKPFHLFILVQNGSNSEIS